MPQLHVNIIHRPTPYSPRDIEGFEFQQKVAHDLGIRTTILVPFRTLFHPGLIAKVQGDAREFGDEIGLWLGDYMGSEFHEHYETTEAMFWLLPEEVKRGFGRIVLAKFSEVFGHAPGAIGAYVMDSASLRIFKELAPEIAVSVATCFEEGVNMFHGTRQCWHLLNDGGPWSAWYPSKANALCPAKDRVEEIGILAVPHLTRDMVLSIFGRNDFFASHPPNMLRGKVYDGPGSAYHLNFIDQWVHQAKEINGDGYYQIHVSLPWMIAQHFFEETVAESRQLYVGSLKHLVKRRDEGLVVFDTMSEYAAHHRATFAYDRTEWCRWQEMLENTGLEYLWAINSTFRVVFDLSQAGCIVDLRPYVGRVLNNTGSDEPGLWFASYPYVVNTYLRHGMGSRVGRGSLISARFECNGQSRSLQQQRPAASLVDGPEGKEVHFAPMEMDFDGVKVVLSRQLRIDAQHRILTAWKVDSISDPAKRITVTSYFSGAVGNTEYPDDNRGTVLYAESAAQTLSLVTRYAGIARTLPGANLVAANMGKANTRLALAGDRPAQEAFLHDEPLFCPFFNIGLTHELSAGESLNLCLTLTKL